MSQCKAAVRVSDVVVFCADEDGHGGPHHGDNEWAAVRWEHDPPLGMTRAQVEMAVRRGPTDPTATNRQLP